MSRGEYQLPLSGFGEVPMIYENPLFAISDEGEVINLPVAEDEVAQAAAARVDCSVPKASDHDTVQEQRLDSQGEEDVRI